MRRDKEQNEMNPRECETLETFNRTLMFTYVKFRNTKNRQKSNNIFYNTTCYSWDTTGVHNKMDDSVEFQAHMIHAIHAIIVHIEPSLMFSW